MSRLSLLALLAACTGAPRPVATAPVVRYTLQPIHTPGREGMHSAAQTATWTEGTLELQGDRAHLVLARTLTRDPIVCTFDPKIMQACSPPGSRSTHATTRTVLDGTWRDGTAMFDGRRLACSPGRFGLTCNLDGVPEPLVFASAATHRLALAETALADGQRLAATIDITGATAHLRLALAGAPTVEATGRVSWAPAGLVIEMGGPVGRASFICTEAARGLTCDAGIDHELFDRPSTWGAVTFTDG